MATTPPTLIAVPAGMPMHGTEPYQTSAAAAQQPPVQRVPEQEACLMPSDNQPTVLPPIPDSATSDAGGYVSQHSISMSAPSSSQIIPPLIQDGSSATGKFGALGGKLATKRHGFTLHIPPGALEEDETISLHVLTEIPNGLKLKQDERLVSHGYQCYPSGLRFKKPAKLIIPHFASVMAPNKVQTMLYSWNQSGTPKRISDPYIICSVRELWLEVSISHFSGGFFAIIQDWLFMKGILLSCMSFLPRRMPSSRKPVMEVRFVKKPHGQTWKDVHDLNNPGFQHVKVDDDDIVFRRGTLTVTCQMGEKGTPCVRAIQYSEMSSRQTMSVYFVLDLTEESDEALVTLELTQVSTQTIKFYTHFQDDTGTNDGNNDQLKCLKHGDVNSFGGLSAPPEILARGPRAQQAYAEAAKAGKKNVFRTRLMLVGQERVGKTSLKKTLTRQGFDRKEAMTDGIETTDGCEISIEVAEAGGKMWSIHKKGREDEDKREDEYEKALADDIAKRLTVTQSQNKERKPHSRGLNPEDAEDEMAKRLTVTPHQDQESLEPHSDTALGSGLNPLAETKEKDDKMPHQIASLVAKVLKEQVHQKEIGTEGVSLSIWDFAGHDIYYSTHQVFLTWRAIYVIVFDLSRRLDEVVPPEMVKGGAKSELTRLEFINFWLYSIYAHAVAPSSVITKNMSKTAQKSPPIFIVGTHRESLKGDAQEKSEQISSAFKEIRESIMGKPFQCHVVPKIFAVENSLEDEDEELVTLRRHIERVAMTEPYMGEEIPLKWLLFEEALAAEKIDYMSLDQTKELTQQIGMESERELLTMLTFYHDLGKVVYYGGIEDQHSLLRDMVILKPQWLIDVFKQVITILDPAKRDGIVCGAWNTLEKHGILEDSLIQHMWQEFLEQKEALVKLMSKFDLICEAPVERRQQEEQDGVDTEVSSETEKGVKKRYYVPSRLTSRCPAGEIAQITSSTDFYVDFRGFLPDGLFHMLMSRAVRWMSERDGKPVKLFHRHISLMVDGVHHALIEMLPPCEATIKVIVYQGAIDHDGNSNKPPAPSVVKEVMDFVTENLDSLIQHWARRIKYDVRFLCTRCSSKKLLKDCFKGISLQCGLNNIPTAAIRFKFGMSKEGVESGNESSINSRTSSSLQRNEDATQKSAPSYQTSRSATSGSSQGQPKFYDIYLKFSQDTDDVHKVKNIIRRNGWTMMTAADSRLGVPKMTSIEDALKTCSHVVFIITKEDCEKDDTHWTMTLGMAFQLTVGRSLNGRVISIRCCEETHLPLPLQSLENACINDPYLEDKLKRTIDVSIRKKKERSSVGTSSKLPTEGSSAPPVSSDLGTQPLAAARVASEVERILPRINDLPAVPSSSVNIHGNVYNIGSMYATGRHDLVPQHPMIIPLAVRHELSKLLNGPRVTHDDWKGLASALGLDDYIASLTRKLDPTSDLIDLAEKHKKICSLEDLRLILKQMKRDDCVDVLDAGASVESNNRLRSGEK